MVGYKNQLFFLLCKSFHKERDNQEGAFGGKFFDCFTSNAGYLRIFKKKYLLANMSKTS